MNLIERVDATQKTIDQFLNQPFVWGTGDCAVLAATHLGNFGLDTELNDVKGYDDERGAKRALVKLGAKGMDDLADRRFERIAPASALVGDIVGFPGGEEGDEWVALGVCIGSHIIGYAAGKCRRGPIDVCTHAWRVAL